MNERIKNLIQEDNGYLRVKLAESHGIARTYIYDYLKNNPSFMKIAAGIYYDAVHIAPDMLYVLSCRNPGIIYSHMTAAHIHQITRAPETYDITVRQGYNTLHFGYLVDQTVIHQISSKELFLLGKIRARDPLGNVVPVYDTERTICDLLHTKDCFSQPSFSETMTKYFRRATDDQVKTLIHYAEILKVSDKVELCLSLFGKRP